MDVIRQNPIVAAILGGLAVMALIIMLLSNGGDSGPSIPASGETPLPSSAPPTTTVPAGPALTRPDVRTLKCGTLLPNDAIKAALGNPSSWGMTALAEDCQIDTDESSAAIQIAPGSPADFDPGAQIWGVTGEPVEGVGDLALWFGGREANGDGGIGVIVVAIESELGALIFRIAVRRPDLDSDAQLEVAKTLALAALPQFPGIAAPEPDPVERPRFTAEPEAIDLSNQSLAENLLIVLTPGSCSSNRSNVNIRAVITDKYLRRRARQGNPAEP